MYKNDTGKAIYANKDGQVVDEGDESAAFLVVGPNGSLSAKEANRYGLSNQDKVEAKQDAPQEAEKPAEAPADTKAVDKPTSTKAITQKETK